MARRLYLRLYLTFLAVAVASLFLTAVLARAFHEPGAGAARSLVPLARSVTCDTSAPCREGMADRLAEAAGELGLDVVIWNGQGQPVFQAGRLPFSAPKRMTPGWHHGSHGAAWLIPLREDRFLGIRERGHFGPRGRLFLPILGGLALLMAIGLYPLSRSITRRVEQLAEGARLWATGELGHRVPVSGKDEIAALTERFNEAAAAIQGLLAQERNMLASASHELRSPLARIRMALELLAEEPDASRREALAGRAGEDIVELDALVEELLVTARAQPGVPRRAAPELDLLRLVLAEAERAGAEARGEAVGFAGEAAMLRHMVRNLFTNARLHGGGSAIRAEVRRDGNQILIAVEDDGPGVPESERERIFTPFYRAPGPRPPGDTGLGLGLALVRQVARFHGGDARYVGREGGGSRFEVRLPKSA